MTSPVKQMKPPMAKVKHKMLKNCALPMLFSDPICLLKIKQKKSFPTASPSPVKKSPVITNKSIEKKSNTSEGRLLTADRSKLYPKEKPSSASKTPAESERSSRVFMDKTKSNHNNKNSNEIELKTHKHKKKKKILAGTDGLSKKEIRKEKVSKSEKPSSQHQNINHVEKSSDILSSLNSTFHSDDEDDSGTAVTSPVKHLPPRKRVDSRHSDPGDNMFDNIMSMSSADELSLVPEDSKESDVISVEELLPCSATSTQPIHDTDIALIASSQSIDDKLSAPIELGGEHEDVKSNVRNDLQTTKVPSPIIKVEAESSAADRNNNFPTSESRKKFSSSLTKKERKRKRYLSVEKETKVPRLILTNIHNDIGNIDKEEKLDVAVKQEAEVQFVIKKEPIPNTPSPEAPSPEPIAFIKHEIESDSSETLFIHDGYDDFDTDDILSDKTEGISVKQKNFPWKSAISYRQSLPEDLEVVNNFPFTDPKFRKYVHVETCPNGEASVLHAYKIELKELTEEEQDLFATDFCKLSFIETKPNTADFVMGIVHDALTDMPDFLEYFADNHSGITVKAEVLGQRDIVTMDIADFRNKVNETYSRTNGMYRYENCFFMYDMVYPISTRQLVTPSLLSFIGTVL